jgi:hypothetical protein
MSVAVEDWDDLSVARRRRGEPAASEEAATAEGAEGGEAVPAPAAPRAATPSARQALVAEFDDADDFDYGDSENLRPVLSVAAGNIAIWALAHLTGVVELIGVSFFASVGLLLASYVLREWHRDRAALVCLAGALPLPVTIFSLLT